ncbi:MAG: PilZ domain-containing protein [Gaiellales bacterium]
MSVPSPTPHDPLSRFLGMLPPLPTSVSVFAPRGGVEEIMLATVDNGLLVGYGPQAFLNATEVVTNLRDDSGSGHDVVLSVAKAFFQAGDQALLHLEVADIIPRPGHRETPRARLSEMARAHVSFSTTLPHGQEFEVRMADASSRGIAFITDLELALGDRVDLTLEIDGRPLELSVLVYHSEPATFGRNRVGCEITAADPADRDLLSELAADDDAGEHDRRPELKDALEQSRADRAALQQRLNPRRYG